MNKEKSPILPASNASDIQFESIEEIRSKLANAALISSSIIGFFVVAASLFRTIVVGWQDIMFLHVGLFLAAMAILIFLKSLNYYIRAFILPGVFFICGVAGLLRLGLIGMGIPALITCCILMAIFFGSRSGFVALAASLVVIAVIGVGVQLGKIDFKFDMNTYAVTPFSWIFTTTCSFCFIGILVAILGRLHSSLINSVSTLHKRTSELRTTNEHLNEEIIERKRAEDALRERESRYRIFFEKGPDGIVVLDPETAKPIEYNDQVCRQLGYSREEFAQLQLSDIEVKETAEETQEHIQKVINEGYDSFETLQRTKQGETRHVHVTAQIIDVAGRPVYHCIWRDITDRKIAEAAHRESEARYADLYDNAPDMYISVEAETALIRQCNQTLVNKLGYKKEEIIDRPVFNMYHPDCMEEAKDAFRLFVETGKVRDAELQLKSKDGSKIDVSLNVSAVRDEKGKIQYSRSSLRDITEIKKAEKARLETLARFSGFAEASQYGMGMADLDGHIVYVNSTLVSMLGEKSQEDCLGKHFPTTYYPQLMTKKLQDEVIPALMRGGHWHGELELLTADGRCVPTEENYFVIRDEHGEPCHLADILTDITERKHTEVEMNRLRSLLKNIIDSMPSVIIGVDKEGCVTQWNKEAERVTGLLSEETYGNILSKVFPRLASQMEKVNKSVGFRKIQRDLKVAHNINGETRYSDITVYPLISNGVDGAVIRVDDVTERVRIEEMMIQSEKMLSLGGLAAGVAHEINNPLAGIIQNVQVTKNRMSGTISKNLEIAAECGTTMDAIESYMDKRDIFRMLDSIMESGKRAAKIVENMLSFSRKDEARFAKQDLAALLDKSVELAEKDYDLKKKYDFRQIEVVREYDPSMPPAMCEGSKIQQVFFNILKNGAHAMSEGRAKTIEVVEQKELQFVLRLMPEGGMARIEIEDNGPGMDETIRKRVFEPFFTTKSVRVGTGLGLFVSYFIITENHGGTMAVESAPGKGTKFIIRLPIERNVH